MLLLGDTAHAEKDFENRLWVENLHLISMLSARSFRLYPFSSRITLRRCSKYALNTQLKMFKTMLPVDLLEALAGGDMSKANAFSLHLSMSNEKWSCNSNP